ncbi:hypothetical protein TWF694_011345 [Orbilia ellipsospora]|uniref:Uncharacterized protein n=1 Tax=Orbilia ellipsospora TaxID=2528407 RepID=A0AAV9X643_9PEZI
MYSRCFNVFFMTLLTATAIITAPTTPESNIHSERDVATATESLCPPPGLGIFAQVAYFFQNSPEYSAISLAETWAHVSFISPEDAETMATEALTDMFTKNWDSNVPECLPLKNGIFQTAYDNLMQVGGPPDGFLSPSDITGVGNTNMRLTDALNRGILYPFIPFGDMDPIVFGVSMATIVAEEITYAELIILQILKFKLEEAPTCPNIFKLPD